MPNTTPVVINAAPDFQAAIPPNLVPIYADLGLPDAACALFESGAIRLLAEPVAAMARLSGHARVLIAGCRRGDGASTVAGALALDLALRLGVDTLLAGAEREYPETRTGANGRPLRIGPSGVTHLSVARWAKIPDPARAPRMPLNDERSDPAEIIEELEASMGRYRAVVIDLGVARLDARMLAMTRDEDPVLVVTRYGCSRRDELAATLAVIAMARRSAGGMILNDYQSPAIDRLQRIAGLGVNGR